ncbi:hypothetical protein [Sphingomonas sp. RT2P30]|uniref:hypothetical protein n=1 Tax=Parasphingomonas halimpatiens TaxID=3096162 RepID=UPI002FC5AC6E
MLGIVGVIIIGAALWPKAPDLPSQKRVQAVEADIRAHQRYCQPNWARPVAGKPLGHREGCEATEGQARYQADDLIATARASDASEESVWLTYRQSSATLVSAICVYLALLAAFAAAFFAERAAYHTKRTANLASDANVITVDESKKSLRVAKRGNELAAKNAERQLRPYVFPSHAGFKIGADALPVASITIKNFGQTPAINKRGWTHTWVECFPLHDPLPAAPDDLDMSCTVIGPGATSDAVQPHGTPLNASSLIEIEEGRAALYVYGAGTYADIFGRTHWYKFCYFASGENSLNLGRLSPYSSGNEIDFD